LPERVFYTDNFGIGLRASAVATDLQMMERSLRLSPPQQQRRGAEGSILRER
jgi:hypothetical protein